MLEELKKKSILYGIGVMSGTSLDGIDVSLVKIQNQEQPIIKMISFISVPYSEDLKKKILRNSMPQTSNVQEICSLNTELGYAYANAISKLIDISPIKMNDVDFIANHGQTFWHNPQQMDGFYSSTLQLGDASIISKMFNKLVIYDFRSLDMAYGGSGAPLIPMSEYLLYKSQEEDRVLVNIGGISNITYLNKKANLNDLTAFDTGPGNMLIDGAMKVLYNLPYDDLGMIAKKGRINDLILAKLMDDTYFKMVPPKTTGREKYNQEFLQAILDSMSQNGMINEDKIATITAFTARSIVDQTEKFLPTFRSGKMIISGGGANNEYLMELIKKYHYEGYQVLTGKEFGYNNDAKEAVGFAILGYLRILNKPNNVKSATGAQKAVSLGSMILPQEMK